MGKVWEVIDKGHDYMSSRHNMHSDMNRSKSMSSDNHSDSYENGYGDGYCDAMKKVYELIKQAEY